MEGAEKIPLGRKLLPCDLKGPILGRTGNLANLAYVSGPHGHQQCGKQIRPAGCSPLDIGAAYLTGGSHGPK